MHHQAWSRGRWDRECRSPAPVRCCRISGFPTTSIPRTPRPTAPHPCFPSLTQRPDSVLARTRSLSSEPSPIHAPSFVTHHTSHHWCAPLPPPHPVAYPVYAVDGQCSRKARCRNYQVRPLVPVPVRAQPQPTPHSPHPTARTPQLHTQLHRPTPRPPRPSADKPHCVSL